MQVKRKSPTKKKSKKPAWAYTKGAYEDKAEEEMDGLVDFATSLDFDKYIQDFEVKTMLQALEHRVKQINNEDEWKEDVIQQ